MIFSKMERLVPKRNYKKIREEGDFLIVLSEELNIHYLNSMAKDIYIKFNGEKNILDIYEELKNEYEVADEELKNDFIILIRDFQWNNLLYF